MSICDVQLQERREQIERWIEQRTTTIREVCRDVVEQIERWETRTEQRCAEVRNQVCSALPWPLSLLCTWVVSVVCWLVSVAMEVIEWVTRRVCELITTVISLLTRVLIEVVTVVVNVVCVLFVPPRPPALDDEPGDLAGVRFEWRKPDGEVEAFLWGVATAAAQVEGNIADNDWERFTSSRAIRGRTEWRGEQGGTHLRIEPPGRATDHWDLAVLAEDLDRTAALGLNAYRLSIEWSRVQPDVPPWARRHIDARAAADALREDARAERQIGGEGAEERAAALEARADERDADAAAAIEAPYDAAEFDPAAVRRYAQMIWLIQERGMEPVLTLHHMSLPVWVLTPPIAGDIINLFTVEDDQFRSSLRGWESEATVRAYAKLVRFLVPFFAEDVRWWVTVNEPIGSMTAAPYLAGVWPPGFLADGDRALRVYRNLIRAHVAAYDTIKELAGERARVGFSHWVAFSRPAPQTLVARWLVGDNLAARNQWAYAFVQYFLDAVVLGHDNLDVWRKTAPTIREDWRDHADFIAPQYYRAVDVWHDKALALRAPWAGGQFRADLREATDFHRNYFWNDLGWTLYPAGLYHLMREFADRYRRPIFLTENGTCEFQDRNRAAFTLAHLQQVLRAIRDGVEVIGYLHWSVVDNWEWAFGYEADAQFGLFTVDRIADPEALDLRSFPRHITEGAFAYQYLIANDARLRATARAEDPFAAAVERYGVFAGDGRSIGAPQRQHGGIWTGAMTREAGAAEPIVLYLTRLAADGWLGMVYVAPQRRWYRLSDVAFDPERRELTFRHRLDVGEEAREAAYAATARGEAPATTFSGTVDWGGERREWTAERDLREGIWTADGRGPSHLGISRFELTDAPWRLKLLAARPWAASEGTVMVDGDDIRTPLGPRSSFAGRFEGRRLIGTRTEITRRGVQRNPWVLDRLPEDAVP
jgi:beta-glucosidase/6-phospho-beta-glucosidase/beta-galactosidase